MKVTVLVENTGLEARRDLAVEHGLSLHIEHDGRQILFDTGASEAYAANAEKLGIDIRQVDVAIISHHHDDHGGGLAHFLKTNVKAPVYLQEHTAGECYSIRDSSRKRIGLDAALLSRHADRCVFVDRFSEISPDVFILTDIGSSYPQPAGNRNLYVKNGDTYDLDRFDHEMVMVVRGRDGLVVFTGCSHHGILNMLDAVRRQFGDLPIKAVLGGFHLGGLTRLEWVAGGRRAIKNIGRAMLGYAVESAYTGHCTGAKGFRALRSVMGETLVYLPTGSVVEI